ncbi:diaminopimelate decarboxylase [Neptunomonas japonica]|uniref:Diaminopimelate decarboxylase n=1 Tax=Neptunomonas japonica JAMM 1380 TaxID=1441457 RepID=A0A7R6P8U0_9GAMM|nr:diaminopimelate decarboxylase [Neptunomonas japonica]BBB27969.1 diaminopimelate decarboxylase [Neptunomonas japonica JAMM 1380]
MTPPLTEHIIYTKGQLHIEACSIESIAAKVNTPFYCYSKAQLLSNIHRCQTAFQPHSIDIHYAMKANSNLSILRLIADQGLGVDLVSSGELLRAQAAGIPEKSMIFSGVGKTAAEFTLAIHAGVGQFNVESVEELEMLATLATQHARPINAALRVNPDVAVDTHKNITTGSKGNKFGITIEQALSLYQRYADHPWIKLNGLAMHIGSQIQSVAPYSQAIDKLMALTAKLEEAGFSINSLDLGGGFGVDYGDGAHLDLSSVAQDIARSTAGFKGRIIVEPGRSLVANAGVLVSRITYIKEAQPNPFLILDAAMNDLMRPALYQASHPIVSTDTNNDSAMRHYDIVGPICESTDTFTRNYPLSKSLKAGELVAFLCTGAYGAVMSSAYNSRSILPELLVSGTEMQVIRKEITQAQLIEYEQ